MDVNGINLEQLWLKVSELCLVYGAKLLAAFVVFIVGKWAARMLARILSRWLEQAHIEMTLTTFLRNLVYYTLLAFVLITALGQLGVQTTSFVALIGATGLAVGLALQGSLSNFAAGVLMVMFRPFRVGDFVEAAGTKGTVKEVQIFTTILEHPDGRKLIVPNAPILSGVITIGQPATR